MRGLRLRAVLRHRFEPQGIVFECAGEVEIVIRVVRNTVCFAVPDAALAPRRSGAPFPIISRSDQPRQPGRHGIVKFLVCLADPLSSNRRSELCHRVRKNLSLHIVAGSDVTIWTSEFRTRRN